MFNRSSLTRVSVVLVLSISVMVPTFSFGIAKKIADSCFVQNYRNSKWLRWSRSSVLDFSTQVREFKPGRSRRTFKAKNPQHAFLRRGSKPSVPCRKFAACKRSIKLPGIRNLGTIPGHLYRPQSHLSLLGSHALLRTSWHTAAKVGTSKGGENQWQTTPKNLPRMQCARALTVT